MRLEFLGVRGSTPAPGAEFARYGGHTSCIALAHGPGDPYVLVLDAGTGLRMLTARLHGAPFRGSILLSHLHWDHVQGLPFFGAGDRPGSRVAVHVPEQSAGSAHSGWSGRDLIASFMSPPAFPITPEGLVGGWTFPTVAPGTFGCEGFEVTAFEVAHKGGRTLGFRVDATDGSIAYVPDHAPKAGVSAAALAGISGVDVLIHDAQFVAAERARADDYGHATVDDAVWLAERAAATALVLFHHGPHRTDDALDVILAGARCPMHVLVAREGMTLDVPAGR